MLSHAYVCVCVCVYYVNKGIKYSGVIYTHKTMRLVKLECLSFSPLPSYFAKSIGINRTKYKKCVEISQIIY